VAPGKTPGMQTRVMMEALALRGPDSEGFAEWPGVALGHRRLAILDLSAAGHQPMLSEDGQIGLVFNGCIYNFQELRIDLERQGYRFRSHTDTEVLLHGYAAWGIDALARKVRGMYAFGIWDQRDRKLSLVRDRLGVKPLLYASQGGQIAFASTAGALHQAGFSSGVDEDSALEFLDFGVVTDERCIWKGLHKLPPASILEWQDGRSREWTYWTLEGIDPHSRVTFEEAVEETERLLIEAVRLRLFADVPIGVLLSGGIDSSLVCWAMREANANITAFTVGTPGDPADETAAAGATAQKLGIRHEIVTLGENPSLDELTEAYSEPFACSSALGMLQVSKAVKPNATVLLTGDGGDDVFLGYDWFLRGWQSQKLARLLPPGADAVWRMTSGILPQSGVFQRIRTFMEMSTGGVGSYGRIRQGIGYYSSQGMFGQRLQGDRTTSMRKIEPSMASARRQMQEMFDLHRRMTLASEFMPKVDGGTMYYALEARAPFLDHKLWEFAARLPEDLRLRQGQLKAVLREIARRRIGPEVAQRPKQGFTIPVERWLAQRWKGSLESLQGKTELAEQGWIQMGPLQSVIRGALASGSVPVQLWYLIVFECWLRANRRSVITKEISPAAVV